MLLKIYLLSCMALLATADNSIENESVSTNLSPETRVEHSISVSFESSHKRPKALSDDAFETSHKIALVPLPDEVNDEDFKTLKNLQRTMNLLPTKERPELNPVLSALINEDVMKSIEAKRAIEEEELEIVKAEADAAIEAAEINAAEEIARPTEAPFALLTTATPIKKIDLNDDINMDFVDQSINLDVAGSENNKKSRIEIKKGPNGQEYEYEYVYYYEDEDDDSKAKASEPVEEKEANGRGKSRYTNIDRSTTATPADNSLVSGKAKGRSSNAAGNSNAAEIEPERLPTNTRFPSRGKNIEVPPTPALDSVENAAEKRKISVKRPSLELVDSDTFNTDEKQAKGARNGDTEAKPAIAIEQERAAAAAAAIELADKAAVESKNAVEASDGGDEESATEKSSIDVDDTTPTMEKAALDLYAILANENFNMEMTTDGDIDVTTILPGSTNSDGDEGLTTLIDEEPSSTTTTTTTTTTTEAPTTTTTTTISPVVPLFGGKRNGLAAAGRNRFKLKPGGTTTVSTISTTEAPAASEPTKATRNRFSRPSIGGRSRPTFRTTAAPAAEPAPSAEEEEVAVKEVKPVSSGFGRGRPRNRFNLRGSTTTEKPAAAEPEEGAQEEAVSSTTARTLRGRPGLNLRGRSRTTTTKAPASEDEEQVHNETSNEEKPAAPTQRPSRFNINRPGGSRLLPRGKFGRTTEATTSDDSAVDSSHHNDVKGEDEVEGEKSDTEGAPQAAGGFNRPKSRPNLNNLHKTESAKPKVVASPLAPRKVNPLLAKRRLQLGSSTTEAAPAEEDGSAPSEEVESKGDTAPTAEAEADSPKDDTTEEAEATTKQQARGLGLLTQRRRLPLRKPGTIL